MIRQVKGRRGNIIEAPQDIAHTLVEHLREKYGFIDVDESCVAMMIDVVQPTDCTDYAAHLKQIITSEELLSALKSGGRVRLQDPTASAGSFI
jgi:hypothetical protein